MAVNLYDPRGLIDDAFKIDGISVAECRAIFLDWALGLPAGQDVKSAVTSLLSQHSAAYKYHPMTLTLCAALEDAAPARRRGGHKGRVTLSEHS